ncbi:MAG: glycosyltransferase family 4 protein [Candidatus Delongbacteria bacterium]|jgi:glycosyltransferase involved in cell wall biosynthesis|nr:glycosyltransferase family 4 protein [Candidatus Delongbacteria bacterium]
MKVLLINHFPLQGSGSGIYTMNIANELVKKGHEVFVIDIDNVVDNNIYNFTRKTIYCDSSINPNADIPFNFPCFTTHPRSTVTYYDLTDEEIKIYVDTYIKIVSEIVDQFKPDIIHAQHMWVAPYAAMKARVPYVITVHGTDLMGFKNDERYHKYAIEAAYNAKKIITISQQVHNDTLELYDIPEEKLVLNPNGFDSDLFKVKEIVKEDLYVKFGLGNPNKLVSFVGKFTDFKGIDVLINAARIVTDKLPGVKFALAGDGELRTQMESLTKALALENIYFLGHQDQNSVADLYNLADVSVVPSRIEPFGLVAIEALACGTPVVATNAGGLPDFINVKVGQLVRMEDHNALADALIEELENNSKLTKGVYAAGYALKNYSWSKTIENVIDIY